MLSLGSADQSANIWDYGAEKDSLVCDISLGQSGSVPIDMRLSSHSGRDTNTDDKIAKS
jgi:hypothetical protein